MLIRNARKAIVAHHSRKTNQAQTWQPLRLWAAPRRRARRRTLVWTEEAPENDSTVLMDSELEAALTGGLDELDYLWARRRGHTDCGCIEHPAKRPNGSALPELELAIRAGGLARVGEFF